MVPKLRPPSVRVRSFVYFVGGPLRVAGAGTVAEPLDSRSYQRVKKHIVDSKWFLREGFRQENVP